MPELYNIRAYGPLACFSLPYGPERTSSLIPSHDAAEHILKSIYGPWEVSYVVEEIHLLTQPTKFTLTLNEVYKQAFGPRSPQAVSATGNRTQRTTTFLRDPDYVIKGRPILSGRGTHDTNMTKVQKTFERRMAKGQHHKQPYLGMRECTAYVERLDDVPPAAPINADLGLHYFGFDFETRTPYFTPLRIESGVVKYPTWEEVKSTGMRGLAR